MKAKDMIGKMKTIIREHGYDVEIVVDDCDYGYASPIIYYRDEDDVIVIE